MHRLVWVYYWPNRSEIILTGGKSSGNLCSSTAGNDPKLPFLLGPRPAWQLRGEVEGIEIPGRLRRRMFEPGVAQRGEEVMARETRSAGILGDLQRLSGTMEANKEELPQMEPFRLKLTGIVTQAFEVAKLQAAHKVAKQARSQ